MESWMAEQLEELGRPDAALEYLERALERDPENAQLHRRVGELSSYSEDEQTAEQAFEAMIVLDPQNLGHWQSLATFQLQRERYEEARRAVDRAVEAVGRTWPRIAVIKARAYLAEGELVEAITVMRGIVEAYPKHYDIHTELRRVYEMLGEQTLAKAEK
jgi:tetratricopeptide (TPR) repeat protein